MIRATRATLAWLVMTLLALAVAAYAASVTFVPALRYGLLGVLFAERPVAAFAHLGGGTLALVAGALQLNARLRATFVDVHRWIGRLYVVAVIAAGVAGFALAVKSSGGLVAHVGFGLLAVIWLLSTINAYRYVRRGDLRTHRVWMIRSYALTLAAVTLRIYMPLSQLAGIPIGVAYPAIAWLCWVPNLLVAEWFIRSPRSFAALPVSFSAKRI